MRMYRISPSLLNSFTAWLNSDEIFEKYWAGSERPAMTQDEFKAKQLAELLSYINREPQPLNEAADRGTCLNEIVDGLLGKEPNPSVYWDRRDYNYIAERNGFQFVFDGVMVNDLVIAMNAGIPQFHLEQTYKPEGCNYSVCLHGFVDYIFPTQIWDLKTTSKYEGEKYANNWQRLVYPVVAVDSGDMLRCDLFGFHVIECRDRKTCDGRKIIDGRVWRETYDVNIEDARSKILEFVTCVVVPKVEEWESMGLISINQTIITES